MPRCPHCRAINNQGVSHCTRCNQLLGPVPGTTEDTGENTSSPIPEASEPDMEPSVPSFSDLTSSEGSAYDQFSREMQGTDDSREPDVSRTGFVQESDVDVSTPLPAPDTNAPSHFGSPPHLVGDVFLARDMPGEQPDFDPFLWLSRLLGLSLILEAVVLFFWGAYQAYGVLILAGLVFCFFLLSRFLGNFFFFALLGAGRLLGSLLRSGQQQVPVRILRIMDDHQTEHIVRIKGSIIRGDIAEYDRVAVWGPRRQGTLLFRYGYNLRAGSSVRLEGRYTWVLTLILALLNIWLLLSLYKMYQGTL